MAGTLVIDTLKASTGVLATQNGMTGIAKAWVNISGATPTINGSFNIGSITKNATGDYTLNFSTAMPDANYAVAGTSSSGGAICGISIVGTFAGGATTKTTTQVRVCTNDTSGYGTTGNGSFIIVGN